MIVDARREVASTSLPVLKPPDAAALDQLASRGATENVVRRTHRVRSPDRLDGDFEVEGQDRDRTKAFGGFDVDAFETDTARMTVVQLTTSELNRIRTVAYKGRGERWATAVVDGAAAATGIPCNPATSRDVRRTRQIPQADWQCPRDRTEQQKQLDPEPREEPARR